MQTINIVPTEIEWRVYRGDTAKLTIFMKDTDGNPVTGAQGVQAQARTYPTDTQMLGSLNCYFGLTPPEDGEQGDMDSGIITVQIPWTQFTQPNNQGQETYPFALGKQFYFDVQVYLPNRQVTIVKVKVDIESDVTRNVVA